MLPLAVSMRLNCTYKFGSWNNIEGETYFCKSVNVSVKTPNSTIDEVEGDHAENKSFDDVKGVDLHSCMKRCHFVPHGIGKYFKNVEVLKIKYAGLRAITKEDLKQFPNLKGLQLQYNKIKTLESGLFQYNPKLQYIGVSNNSISTISSDIFDNLDDLEEAFFGANECDLKSATNKDEVKDLQEEILEKCQPPDDSLMMVGKVEIEALKKMVEELKGENSKMHSKVNELASVIAGQNSVLMAMLDKQQNEPDNVTEQS